MTSNSTKSSAGQSEAETAVNVLGDLFDPIEVGLRDRVREFIQVMIESELDRDGARPRALWPPPKDRFRITRMTQAVSPATGADTDRGRGWGLLGGLRSRCRAPGLAPRRARQPGGRVRQSRWPSGQAGPAPQCHPGRGGS